jgi:hypothetical protein
MRHASKLIMLGIMGAVPVLNTPADSQTARIVRDKPGETKSDVTSVLGCPRPADAKEVKVLDYDTARSVARLAVNLGSGRFKLVRITIWDRPEDPRPLIPVIEAARITQGNVQFYTPNLNTDPESAPDSFILMTEMGGGYICWASPSSLINDGAYPVAEEAKPAIPRAEAKPAIIPRAEAKPAITAPEAMIAAAPANPAPRSRSRTQRQATPMQSLTSQSN